jgi:hypothetical protein
LVSPDMLDFLNEIEFDWPKGRTRSPLASASATAESTTVPGLLHVAAAHHRREPEHLGAGLAAPRDQRRQPLDDRFEERGAAMKREMPRRPGRCGQWVSVCGSDRQSSRAISTEDCNARAYIRIDAISAVCLYLLMIVGTCATPPATKSPMRRPSRVRDDGAGP